MTYDWRTDAFECYRYWCLMKALAIGSRRPKTPAEMYWVELNGGIP